MPMPSPAADPTTYRMYWVLLLILGVLWLVLVAAWWARPVPAWAMEHTPAGFKLDVNQDPAERLTALHGVGPALAERIVKHREIQGPFRHPDELLAVSGIGPVTLQRITPWVRTER